MATILIVDDRPINRKYLATVLEYDGHRILDATNGAEALKRTRAERPDLVITDLVMPAMDGYELARQLRGDPAIAATPLLFYTGVYHRKEAEDLARSCGPCHVLIKPVSAEEILRCVHDLLKTQASAPPSPLPETFDRQRLELLNTVLSRKVEELERVKQIAEGSLAQLEAVFSSMNDGLILCDREVRVQRFNVAALTIHGFPPDFDLRKPLRDFEPLFEMYDAQGNRLPFERWPAPRAVAGETFTACEVRVRRLDTGYEFYGSYSGAPAHDASGQIAGAIASVRDISENKRAEQALRVSERRLSLAITGAHIGIFDWNVAKEQSVWTPQLEAILGYPPTTTTTTTTTTRPHRDWTDRVHPDDLPWVTEQGRRCLAECEPMEQQYRIVWPDGSVHWVEVRALPLRESEGPATQMMGTVMDITKRKQAEEELRAARRSAEQAKAVAEQANRAKDHFLAVLSHELRTPLTPAVMAVSMLQARPDLDPAVQEMLELVRRNVEMEARLIDDLLDVTRIARGKIELARSRVELCTILRSAVEVCKPDIEARSLRFGMDLGPGAPYWVDADVSRLQQVFWNLLKNAIKFTPHGGCVGIRVRKDSDEGLGVRGQGSGVSSQVFSELHFRRLNSEGK